MQHKHSNDTNLKLRKPEILMRLERLGCMHQSRLSFSRGLLRRLVCENWDFHRPVWDIDDEGVGHAIYTAQKQDEAYSLIAFSHKIPLEMRTDRVIAEVWDATFALIKGGKPTEHEIKRLKQNVPLQEMGRCLASEVSLSRANRSVRLWEHVLKRLSSGQQPDIEQIKKIGYLMRTSAVYGSGKFGCADRNNFDGKTLFSMPFYPEMLSVYLIREFSVDLIEHLAQCEGGKKSVKINSDIKRLLGIGNSTGLGMAPFLLNHPGLLNNWMQAREKALAEVLAVTKIYAEKFKLLNTLIHRSLNNIKEWYTKHPLQKQKLTLLKNDLHLLKNHLKLVNIDEVKCIFTLHKWAAENLHLEGQELLTSLLIELFPEKVDKYTNTMFADEDALFSIDANLNVDTVKSIIKTNFAWVYTYDFTTQKDYRRFWYVSQEKSEPRLGDRFIEDGAEMELPLGVAKMIQTLDKDLKTQKSDTILAEFMLKFPEHRHTIRRVCINAQLPYSEIRDNLLSEDMLPLNLLRCKLSFFGVDKFDPRSDRWIRISLFQRAPYANELKDKYDDLWVYADE